MNILFDARMKGPQQRGIGRYIDELLPSMIADQSHEWFVLVRELPPTSPSNVHWMVNTSRWYSLREQWSVLWQLLGVRADILHVPHFNVPISVSILSALGILPPLAITIHDLLLVTSPRTQPTTLPRPLWWIKYAAFRLNLWIALRCVRRIIAVSEVTAHDVRSLLPRRFHDRIVIIPEGAPRLPEHACSPQCAAAMMGPFVLTVGSCYPHKRLGLVFQAAQELRTSGWPLQWVHVGPLEPLSETFFTSIRVQAGEPSWIHAVGFQTDQEVSAWYHHALSFVYLSTQEGFGLPPLEALGCGARVITTRVPSLQQISIDPKRVMVLNSGASLLPELINTLRQWYSESNTPRSLPSFPCSNPSWESAAQATFQAYRDICS